MPTKKFYREPGHYQARRAPRCRRRHGEDGANLYRSARERGGQADCRGRDEPLASANIDMRNGPRSRRRLRNGVATRSMINRKPIGCARAIQARAELELAEVRRALAARAP